MKKCKMLAALLALTLLLGALVACADQTGTCDMDKIQAEINSMKAEDFEL